MFKKLALLLLLAGLSIIIYAGNSLYQSSLLQSNALEEAQMLVNQNSNAAASSSSVKGQSDASSPSIQNKSLDQQQTERFPSNQSIGVLKIPALKAVLPIISGADETSLEKGVGHVSSTSLPGHNDQIVLSGHRDTVFRRFGQLEAGDDFIIKIADGTYTYQMSHSKIVNAEDRTVIHSTYPEEILVLTTCYPFSFIGNAPKRYIIYAQKSV
ncbi:class D sortase [Halobacillus hunanensis]|uniref:class D sortase n=1 Tax=Halobacillus hunanensis TaxID=578214 RepID=UPI0009A8412D|nr:class D sortase [Halobacillus hunanensis]